MGFVSDHGFAMKLLMLCLAGPLVLLCSVGGCDWHVGIAIPGSRDPGPFFNPEIPGL